MIRNISAIDLVIAKRMKAARRESGLSQTALGETLGVTYQQIQKYERAANRVSAATLFNIARVLDRPVAWFLEEPSQGEP